MRRAPFSGHKLPFCRLPTWDETKELLISFVDNPAWQLLLDVSAVGSFRANRVEGGCPRQQFVRNESQTRVNHCHRAKAETIANKAVGSLLCNALCVE